MSFQKILKNQNNYRSNCVNLVPSENVMSDYAKSALSSDFGSRYFFYKPYETESKISYEYFGSEYVAKMLSLGISLSKEIFNCNYASLYPLSGHLANQTIIYSFCNSGDRILCVDPDKGGYPGLTKTNLPNKHNLLVDYIPYDFPNNINLKETEKLILQNDYRLVYLSSAHTLFPEKVKELKEIIRASGKKTLLIADVSHPLGLIAGKSFDNPLDNGADIMVGSTQKSFPGPQGGIILCNNKELIEKVDKATHFIALDNPHFHRIASLVCTLEEMKKYGNAYSKQTILNSKALASCLDKAGMPIMYSHKNYTESHQFKIDLGSDIALFGKLLEKSNIIIDCSGRLGVNEMTRYGMKEDDMKTISSFISRIYNEGNAEEILKEVINFRMNFQEVKYC